MEELSYRGGGRQRLKEATGPGAGADVLASLAAAGHRPPTLWPVAAAFLRIAPAPVHTAVRIRRCPLPAGRAFLFGCHVPGAPRTVFSCCNHRRRSCCSICIQQQKCGILSCMYYCSPGGPGLEQKGDRELIATFPSD